MKRLTLMALLILAGCEQAERAIGGALSSRKAIAELKYSGDRPDAPPLEERGNAVFTDAAYDQSGTLLITLADMGSARMQVWDVETGALISGFDAIVPNPGSRNIWMIDGTRKRIFARTGKNDGYALFDLMTGNTISTIADTDDGAGGTVPPPPAFREPYAVGLTADGTQALIFKSGVMELWNVETAKLARREASPFTKHRFIPAATGGTPGSTYTDKHQWEWSPDRRTLAMAFTPEEPVNATTEYMLLDVTTLELQRIYVPEVAGTRTFTAFAFSPDHRWLAVGNHEEVWLYERSTREWVRSIQGEEHRSNALAPMRFTADSKRLIALGDQLQINVFDVESGARLGRYQPPFGQFEGAIKISNDGSRIIVYRFLPDIFEVLDGADTRRIGWVCPYFCNVMHAPNQPGYAVSPDGKLAAVSHRRGAAVWDTATDTIRFPLRDPKRKPLPWPRQQ